MVVRQVREGRSDDVFSGVETLFQYADLFLLFRVQSLRVGFRV